MRFWGEISGDWGGGEGRGRYMLKFAIWQDILEDGREYGISF